MSLFLFWTAGTVICYFILYKDGGAVDLVDSASLFLISVIGWWIVLPSAILYYLAKKFID